MKKLMISAAIFIATFNLSNISAQHVTVGYSGGYGTYAMDDMKDFMSKIKYILPIDVVTINNFRGYYNQTIQAGYALPEHQFGLEYGMMSTGGKIGYSDYSGFLYEELNMKADKFGVYYRYLFYNQAINKNKLSAFASLSPGVLFSKMDLEENFELNVPAGVEIDPSREDKATFESTNFYVLPQLGLSFNFLKYFCAQLAVGYEIGINGNMELKGSSSLGEYRNNYKMDWSGLRANLGITILLPTKK